jgi:hypothetical protein
MPVFRRTPERMSKTDPLFNCRAVGWDDRPTCAWEQRPRLAREIGGPIRGSPHGRSPVAAPAEHGRGRLSGAQFSQPQIAGECAAPARAVASVPLSGLVERGVHEASCRHDHSWITRGPQASGIWSSGSLYSLYFQKDTAWKRTSRGQPWHQERITFGLAGRFLIERVMSAVSQAGGMHNELASRFDQRFQFRTPPSSAVGWRSTLPAPAFSRLRPGC